LAEAGNAVLTISCFSKYCRREERSWHYALTGSFRQIQF